MSKVREIINNLSKSQKIICIILILGFVLLLAIGIPTFARYKNRSTITTASVWDGSVATSYRKGTGIESDPYIISNGSELAYFYEQLSSNNYENKYFTLSNDIVLNNGIFSYDATNKIQYTINAQTYYVGDYSNKYYDNASRTGTEIGTINLFHSLNGFKGHFDGGSFTIYGLYMTDENSDEMALFTNLEGNVHDLYVDNAVVYGGIITGGIASTTNNASLSNVLFDGYVIGKSTLSNKSTNSIPIAPIINLQGTPKTDYIDLSNNIPFVGSEIISTSITGNYTLSGSTESDTSIKINGVTVTNGSFNIDLGTNVLNNIPVLTSTTSEGSATLTLSNLSYNIVYKYAASGGIVAVANNTQIINTINKAYVYGYSTSGGLVGVTTNLINLNQSYNVGNIESAHVSGGLVGTIEKNSSNITISKCYNTGSMSASNIGGLIGMINNNPGSISIDKVFNTSTTNYSIGTITGTSVNVTNAYYVNGPKAIGSGTTSGNFTLTTMDNLKTKTYDISNLSFNEFVSFEDLATNGQNAWVYDKGSLPILFIDDLNSPIANIHVGVYSWNNLSSELSTVRLNSNITFSIEDADELRPIKEKYYYISNSKVPLTQTEIDNISSWTSYSGITQITEEGFYVVYVKVVDYDDNVTYLNTDLLVLDLSGSSVKVSINDSTWSNLRSDLGYAYIDRPKSVAVEASDDLSGVASVKYYVTNQILTTDDLNSLGDSSWSAYVDGIPINDIGKYVVYVKVIDNCNYVTYVNTDYIVFNGYTENSLTIGRNASSYPSVAPYINNKSSLTLNMSFTATSAELSNHTHNLISNILLPMGAKITLIDNIMNKVYEYQIMTSDDIFNYNNSCEVGDLDCIKVATYPFTLFKEIGTGPTSKPFTENSYYNNGTIHEDFTIVLDLSNTNVTTNYNNVSLYMELHSSNNTNVRPTLYSSIKPFNIYSNVSGGNTAANLYLTTTYNGNEIIYNSDSQTNINLTSGLNYKTINSFNIIDTTYEDKKIGLAIKMVDSNGNIINRSYLKNIIFKVGDNAYYPEEDNITRINFNDGINEVTKSLTVITNASNSSLEDGTYYLKIYNYAADDGIYSNKLNSNEISIPIKVSDNSNIKYSFSVAMNDESRIISKVSNEVSVSFDILQKSLSIKQPNIRISLYKKDQLTACSQNYSIVDLATYVSNTLNNCTTNVYYVSSNSLRRTNFVLNLITNKFENTGYKFVFDLYDGTKKIGTIEKHFIVK